MSFVPCLMLTRLPALGRAMHGCKKQVRQCLKILPSSHSSATWCIMVNVYLLLSIKSGVLDITIGMIKKVIHFNGKTPSFYNMMYTQIIHKHIYQVFQLINDQFCSMN